MEDVDRIEDVKNRKRGREDGWECAEKMEDERCEKESRMDGRCREEEGQKGRIDGGWKNER